MKRWFTTMATLGTWAWLGLQTASAQQLGGYNPPQVYPQPTFSPYLNMINNPAANYFGRVLPQIDTSRSLQQLQQDLRYTQGGYPPLGMGIDPNAQNAVLTTGHAVTFQNLSYYFPQPGQQFAGMGAGLGTGVGVVGTGFGTNLGTNLGTGLAPTINNTPLPLGYQPR